MRDGLPGDEFTPAGGASALSAELASSLPWHMGFHNEIADMLRPTGDWRPDMVRYKVVQVCAHNGAHVCWAKSPEHAALIIEAVNKMANVELRRLRGFSRRSPRTQG